MATPGSVVNTGALMTPGGDQGSPAYTVTTAGFTVPAVGSTVTITVNDTSWMSPGEFLWIAGANGSGVAGTLQIQSISGASVTLLNPTTVSAGDMFKSTYDQDNNGKVDQIDDYGVASVISQRTRGFNAIGNPNFEVDQRNVGAVLAVPTVTAMLIDRWSLWTGATSTMRFSSQQISGNVAIPGTNFFITQKFLRITVTTAQPSLTGNDFCQLSEYVEGPQIRELLGDVHSIQILCRSSIANLKFNVQLQDATVSHTYTHLCSLGAANTWTLFSIPNIPVWMAAATWSTAPGTQAYSLNITLAATNNVPLLDTWVASGYPGAAGQSNFAATAGATFDVAFVQHEPGPVCTSLIDKPFSQNLDECLRYYCKSYAYGIAIGTVTNAGIRAMMATSGQAASYGAVSFSKPMAKVPTVTLYNHSTGVAGNVGDQVAVNHPGASAPTPGDSGFYGLTFTTAVTANMATFFHYTADTGW